MYWHDYYAYKYQIIPSVLEAMKIWYATDKDGNLVRDENGRYVVCENGNPAYAGNPAMVKPVNAFLYEFGLYGLAELKAKKKAWMECVSLLYRDGFISSGTKENPTSYQTPDEAGWERLTVSQKAQFTTVSAFKDTLNSYLDYMAFDPRPNAITGTSCKGIIRLCEDAISERQTEIASLQERLASTDAKRDALSASVLPETCFSAENLKLFCLLINEADYSNKNIVTTNLDDILTMVDVAETLYQDAKSRLDIASHPQYAFRTTIDNLFALEEFAPLWEDFAIGNFIRLVPDLFRDDSVKLRLISIESNPFQHTGDMAVEFSTMTRSLSGVDDLAFLFGEGASGSHLSSGSSSGSGGTYGKNDADIQIANNMLNALLKSETFGTQIADVVLDSIRTNKGNFGKLIAHSGIFDSLESGQLKVSGDCLFNKIKSSNWDGTEDNLLSNSIGSIIDLSNGYFNLGGKLKWNGKQLNVEGNGKFSGDIIANSIILNKDSVVTGLTSDKLIDASGFVIQDVAIGNQNTTSHSENYFRLSSEGLLEADNAVIHGTIYATDGRFAGDITANRLTADTSGTIAGWTFNRDGFYKENPAFNSPTGIYLGSEGFSIKDAFSVDHMGNLKSTNAFISGGEIKFNGQYEESNESHNIEISLSKNGFTLTSPNENVEYMKIVPSWWNGGKVISSNPMIASKPYCEFSAKGISGTYTFYLSSADQTDYLFHYGYTLRNTYVYASTTSSGSQLRIDGDGYFKRYASSSKMYKKDISTNICDDLNPRKLYDLDIVQFQYNEDYLDKDDQRFGKDIIGFLAEDVNEIYPIACNLKNGEPEVPEYNMLIAPMLKLIQEQHEEIESLKHRVTILEQKV